MSTAALDSQSRSPGLASRPDSRWPLLILLSSIQFVHVLDFVLIMPLAPQLMRVFEIEPGQFGLLVSSYNLAAAVAALFGSLFLDRIERTRALKVIMIGFTVGTVSCAFAIGPNSLLAARALTGFFGGLVQALLFAIVADRFTETNRGAATGTVMSAFSVASVLGVPTGLYFAHHFGWRAPFALTAVFAIGALLACHLVLREQDRTEPHRAPFGTTLRDVARLLGEDNTRTAFILVTSLMFSGFMVIPYIGALLVNNAGLYEGDLATAYLVGGLATMATSRLTGLLADRYGKFRVFTWLAGFSILPTLTLTHISPVAPLFAILVSTLFTVAVSARAIPALAMISSSVESGVRARFLSLTSAIQQASSGVASLLAGSLLSLAPDGRLLGLSLIGDLAAIATLVAIAAAHQLRRPGV